MSAYEHGYSKEYRPISAWGYVGLSILYTIPVIGWLFLIIFTFSRGNINRRNFTRSYWCYVLLLIITVIALFAIGRSSYPELFSGNIGRTINEIKEVITEALDGAKTSLSREEKQVQITPSGRVETKENPAATQTPNISDQVSKATAAPSKSGVTPSFKEAMDSYETFFSEYVDFMKKYSTSANSIGMLVDYMSFMARYAEMIPKMEAMDDGDLSAADSAYYLEVTARIYKKLAEAI